MGCAFGVGYEIDAIVRYILLVEDGRREPPSKKLNFESNYRNEGSGAGSVILPQTKDLILILTIMAVIP